MIRVARACQAHASELVLAITAGALRTVHPTEAGPRLRAMFAVSRDPRRRAATHGNWTGAVSLDLPLASVPPRARVAAVRQSLRTALDSGEPEAAGLVMQLMGTLPAPLHAALARRVYTNRHLNVIVSYVPALFLPRRLAGAPVRAAAPVVALAEGVPIGVAVLRSRTSFDVGVLLDDSLGDAGVAFVAALDAELAELLAGVEAAVGSRTAVGGAPSGGRRGHPLGVPECA